MYLCAMLTHTFLKLVAGYSKNTELANDLWLEIFSRYSEPGRHYHTIDHLEHMFTQLQMVKSDIQDWDSMLFAMFYHDIVYKPTSSVNEAESAKIALARLESIGYPPEQLSVCSEAILATKNHGIHVNNDINYFTDADLSILGASAYDYGKYIEAIRKEFSIFPDFLYDNGRKKVIQHFLKMEPVFKTDYFREHFEHTARINLSEELESLG